MKKGTLTLILTLVLVGVCYSQESVNINLSDAALSAVVDQIDRKAQTLCECISYIGSSHSKLTMSQKQDIIKYDIPNLFWIYKDRIVTTSSGVKGSVIRKKTIIQYFQNLLRQSKQPINREVRYELMYDKVFSDDSIKDLESWERCDDQDNCQVWRQKVRFVQKYYIISHDINQNVEIWEREKVVREEIDQKYMYVYLIVRKDDKRKIALLGDIYMTERLNTK